MGMIGEKKKNFPEVMRIIIGDAEAVVVVIWAVVFEETLMIDVEVGMIVEAVVVVVVVPVPVVVTHVSTTTEIETRTVVSIEEEGVDTTIEMTLIGEVVKTTTAIVAADLNKVDLVALIVVEDSEIIMASMKGFVLRKVVV